MWTMASPPDNSLRSAHGQPWWTILMDNACALTTGRPQGLPTGSLSFAHDLHRRPSQKNLFEFLFSKTTAFGLRASLANPPIPNHQLPLSLGGFQISE
jgi:hypothetical protein